MLRSIFLIQINETDHVRHNYFNTHENDYILLYINEVQNYKQMKYYFPFLINCSKAIVIDGDFGVGAFMSNVNPASSTDFAVVGPNAAILVFFCSKFGKF